MVAHPKRLGDVTVVVAHPKRLGDVTIVVAHPKRLGDVTVVVAHPKRLGDVLGHVIAMSTDYVCGCRPWWASSILNRAIAERFALLSCLLFVLENGL